MPSPSITAVQRASTRLYRGAWHKTSGLLGKVIPVLLSNNTYLGSSPQTCTQRTSLTSRGPDLCLRPNLDFTLQLAARPCIRPYLIRRVLRYLYQHRMQINMGGASNYIWHNSTLEWVYAIGTYVGRKSLYILDLAYVKVRKIALITTHIRGPKDRFECIGWLRSNQTMWSRVLDRAKRACPRASISHKQYYHRPQMPRAQRDGQNSYYIPTLLCSAVEKAFFVSSKISGPSRICEIPTSVFNISGCHCSQVICKKQCGASPYPIQAIGR